MSCLINSLDELPKSVAIDWPTTEEGWTEFAQNYVCVANGQEVPFDSVVSNLGGAVIYYSTIPDGDDYVEIMITDGSGPDPKGLKKSSDEKTINSGSSGGIFDPLTSLTLCEKSSGGKTICGVPVCDDGKEGLVITPTNTKLGNEYAGVSTNNKPIGVPQYSIYFELDTGKFYYYDNGSWSLIPCGSGGDEPQVDGPKIILYGGANPNEILIGPEGDVTHSITELVSYDTLTQLGENVYLFSDAIIGQEIYFSSTGTICSVDHMVNGSTSHCVISGEISCGPYEVSENSEFHIATSAS